MTELALLGQDRLWVSGDELSEAAPTYTVDTLLHFKRLYPEDELHLLIGADSYSELSTWVRFREILELATLVVLARPGAAAAVERAAAGGDRAQPAPTVHLVRNRPVAVSSTEVRRVLARGERPPLEWVPEAVVDFALKYRLYR